MTRETFTLFKPSGATMTSDSVRQGDQMAGFELPKRTTVGRPKAAAMWAGPLSLPMKKAAFEISVFADSRSPRQIV